MDRHLTFLDALLETCSDLPNTAIYHLAELFVLSPPKPDINGIYKGNINLKKTNQKSSKYGGKDPIWKLTNNFN